jgi:hypothetical protein
MMQVYLCDKNPITAQFFIVDFMPLRQPEACS